MSDGDLLPSVKTSEDTDGEIVETVAVPNSDNAINEEASKTASINELAIPDGNENENIDGVSIAAEISSTTSKKSQDLGSSISSDSLVENDRGEWGNHLEYFLTALGLAVGLGNIWRFPYLCYQNGGGTFLVPYLICLLLLGLPLFFLELVLGQFAGISSTKIFARMTPGLRGLGYGMLSIPTMICFYYTVIMAWSWYYMFSGFRSTLPWASCNTTVLESVASDNCFTKYDNDFCLADETFYAHTCMKKDDFCALFGYQQSDGANCISGSGVFQAIEDVTKRIAASEEFYKRKMLKQDGLGVTQTWEHYGDPQWEVIGCLALSWTIIGISLVRGMQSYGKLTYFITLFPYVVLTVFLGLGLGKDGFSEGITDFYLKPDWERLVSDFDVWKEACTQIFYSLGVAIGGQLLLASYNKYDNNCHRDVWLIGLGNSCTSIYAGFVVFGTLGMLAKNNGVPIESVITAGEGLTFQAYPEAIAQMEVPPLFNFLFFLMLCLLAMSSIVGMFEPTVAAIFDELPWLRKYRAQVYLVSCLVGFLGGVSCCFPSGIFMFNILNNHTANSMLYFGLVEVMIVAWSYGVDKFFRDIADMNIPMPRVLKWYWKATWVFISPVMCLVLTILILSSMGTQESYNDYVYPVGAQVLAWLIELSPLGLVLLTSLYTLLTKWRSGEEVAFLRAGPLLSPTEEWGPREDRPSLLEGDLGKENLAIYKDVEIGDVDKLE